MAKSDENEVIIDGAHAVVVDFNGTAEVISTTDPETLAPMLAKYLGTGKQVVVVVGERWHLGKSGKTKYLVGSNGDSFPIVDSTDSPPVIDLKGEL